ncbi:hypothetical protein VPNG_09609 [Cytospora leucostoma]|uniref:F-box domain-containing protein n=1 Tax=Cytospora leucostoma TaxID=1230097 RepID=A0A423VR54_9PEZI|nr:hypothetical protein VPNG_09609 [Cytospora leucostoma]
MAPTTHNLLGLPTEIKFQILLELNGRDLLSIAEVDSDLGDLWDRYPQQICNALFYNSDRPLEPEARPEAFVAFQLREAKREYFESMGDRREGEQDRRGLEETLRNILLGEAWETTEDGSDEMDISMEGLAAYSDLVSEVNSLVDRYANDAWKRIQRIASETGTGDPSPADATLSPQKISLTAEERLPLQRAFIDAEIYLLTTFHHNAQGERHQLDMGDAIHQYVPDSVFARLERRQFDSCMRYIFHAYRTHLRSTARELGVPELPVEKTWQEYENGQSPPQKRFKMTLSSRGPSNHASEADAKISEFSHRCIQDEQKFLLWLCEFGLGPLEQTHRASAEERRDEMLEVFAQRHAWGACELTLVDRGPRPHHNKVRQRHPVKSLYGFYRGIEYPRLGTPWACAASFLDWEWVHPNGVSGLRERGDVVLNERGRWITMSDTDGGASKWNPFESRWHSVPSDHPYAFDRKTYILRSLPARVHLMAP